ncbi:hypothetical protein IAT38_001405 [Cryptococcus sp. DSM 104549]
MVKSNQPLQIRLTEPVIFLKGPSTGLDFRGRPQTVRQDGQPAMVRGLLTLRLSKPTRIRSIVIKLEGKARTEWPEGIGAKRMETSEEHVVLIDQTTFFNALQHDGSRSRSTRRALSLGPGVNLHHDDDVIDDDLDLPDVPRDDDDDADWLNISAGRRGAGARGREMVRSSSAMPGTHDASSWHRDGFSRRPSFDNDLHSARSSLLDLGGLSLRDRGPSPAYTPTASPPRMPAALPLPGHVSRPSSLRQAASPMTTPSREPMLSPIASAAPSQSNSERGDSTETEHRRPAHQVRSTLSPDEVREREEAGEAAEGREATEWEPGTPLAAPQDDYAVDDEDEEDGPEGEQLPRPILETPGSGVATPGEVRFQEPVQMPTPQATPQPNGENEKEEGATSTAPVPPATEAEGAVPPPSAGADSPAAATAPLAPPVTGNRAASVRTFNSQHSASSASLSSAHEHSAGENHPVASNVHAISAATTPALTPPSLRPRGSIDSGLPSPMELSSPASSRRTSTLSAGNRQSSDQSLHNLQTRRSNESLNMSGRNRTARAGSTSTIVEDTPSRFTSSGSSQNLPSSRPPSAHAPRHRTASGTPSIASAPGLAHLMPGGSHHREPSEDSRGRKSGKFSLAATLRGLSRDVKERVQHGGRHGSKSRTRDGGSRPESLVDHPIGNGLSGGSSTTSINMARTGSGSALASAVPESVRHAANHGSRHASMRSEESQSRPDYRRSAAGSASASGRSRSRERNSSAVRGVRDGQERSRSRARGRHMGMKVLTDKLGLGEHEEQADDVHNWKEFRKGTYNYPISFPIPINAPPTIHAEFGSVTYRLKASVVRVGALTPNLTEDMEVVMIATPQEDDMEETENVIVERQWEEQMRYQITLGGKAFPIAGTIPISIRLMPLLKCRIHRLTVALEEKTDYYAQERKVARHETPKRFVLLFIKQPDHKERTEPLLPIISDDPLAAEQSPLAELARNAALNNPPADAFDLEQDPNDSMYASLMEPTGPWHLEKDLVLPDCTSKIKFTTKHDQTNITVAHWLKVTIRVERGDDEALDSKGRRKQFDIIIETPIKILDCRVNPQWNSLPTYTALQRNFAAVPGICSIHSGKSTAPLGTARPIVMPLTEGGTISSTPPAMAAALPDVGAGAGGPSVSGSGAGSHAGTSGHSHPHSGSGSGIHIPHPHRSHRPSTAELPAPTPSTSTAAASAATENGEDTLLERNIVYDRLMSGQLTETGEVPPTYGEAMADAARTRSVSRVREIVGAEAGSGVRGRGDSGSRGSRSRSRLRD